MKKTDIIERWVNNPHSVSAEELSKLSEFAKTSGTRQTNLERIYKTDPGYRIGEIVDLRATSFTGVKVSEGQSAGDISWKTGDGAFAKITTPARGLDIPYASIKTQFGASDERETLVAGKYRVKQIVKITEPGTNPNYGYEVKQYILEES